MKKEDLKILVVDDEPLIRILLKETLAKFGSENVVLAVSVESALRLMSDNFFDVIFTGYEFPSGKNGVDFIRKINSFPEGEEIKVIFMTGSGEEAGLEGARAGADFCILKPFSIQYVKNILDQIAPD